MRKAFFGAGAVSLVAGVVIACGGSGGSGPLDQPGTSSSGGSSGAASSSGGSSGTSSSGGPTGFTPAQAGDGTAFCDNTYGKLVNGLVTCCSDADKQTIEYSFGFGILGGAVATCGPRLEASISKGRLEHDDGAAASCYAAWATLFSGGCASGPFGVSANFKSAEVQKQIESCNLVFRGLVAENGACSGDADCAQGLTCVGWSSNADGTCKQPPALAETCGKAPSEGGTLSLDLNLKFGDHPECATGAYCSSTKCVAQKNPGENCSDDKQCAGGKLCRLNVCGDVGDADLDGACKNNDDCKSGLYCNAPSFGQQGTCQTKLGDGAGCTAINTPCKGRCDRPDGSADGTCKSFCGSG
jgi:hypothetical protein